MSTSPFRTTISGNSCRNTNIMTRILTIFYFLLFFGVGLTSAYIIYHVLRYSLSKQQAIVTAGIFGVVLLFLLAANAVLFFRIDWDTMLTSGAVFTPPSSLRSSTYGF